MNVDEVENVSPHNLRHLSALRHNSEPRPPVPPRRPTSTTLRTTQALREIIKVHRVNIKVTRTLRATENPLKIGLSLKTDCRGPALGILNPRFKLGQMVRTSSTVLLAT
jgi:hypothetical protein